VDYCTETIEERCIRKCSQVQTTFFMTISSSCVHEQEIWLSQLPALVLTTLTLIMFQTQAIPRKRPFTTIIVYRDTQLVLKYDNPLRRSRLLDPTHINLSCNCSQIPGTWGRRSCRAKLFCELLLVVFLIIHSSTLCGIPYLLELYHFHGLHSALELMRSVLL